MDLDRLNKWLTLVANFGVLVGIIFLILELSQNTQALRANAIQNSTDLARQQVMMFSQDADVVRITLAEDVDEQLNELKARVKGASEPAAPVSEVNQNGNDGLLIVWRNMRVLGAQGVQPVHDLPEED